MHRRAFLFFVPVLLAAQPATLPLDKVRAIEQIVSTEMSRSTIPGVTVSIGNAAGLRWSNGYGMADLENLVPATALTEIRLGSISKPITATAVMQLVEKDSIQLDAPIQRYVPTFPQKQWPVTVRQLLGHLGGVRHYAGAEIESTRYYGDRISPLKIFQDDPLLHEPGTKYSYTTYGFNLLGAAVENVARTSFVDFLRANIFQPAGMTRIGPDDVYAIIPHRARGYRLTAANQLVNCGLADTSNKIPGGGLISTADDLVNFALALHAGKLVKPATRDLMFTNQKLASGALSTYGMGWQIAELEGRRMVAHGGGQQGISTYLMLFPQEGLALAVMLNREAAPARDIADKIAALMLR